MHRAKWTRSFHKLLAMNNLTVFKFPRMATFLQTKAAHLLGGGNHLDIPMVCCHLLYVLYLFVHDSAFLSSQKKCLILVLAFRETAVASNGCNVVFFPLPVIYDKSVTPQ